MGTANDSSSKNNVHITEEPFIKASQALPEITFKGVILAMVLTITLAAANAYLCLKVGTTISASIPAAVIAMGILRLFKNSNVLENNIVQTAASSGEAVVGGIAYVIPALLILHFWSDFNYWQTVLISATGGTLGVLFCVILRRILLAEKVLNFPEGKAIGNVLKASAQKGVTIKPLIMGGFVGGTISFCQNGLEIFTGSASVWLRAGSAIIGIGSGFDPAILAAGYIVGISAAVAIFVGVFVGWIMGIPYFSYTEHLYQGIPNQVAMQIWHSHLRYIAVGMMLVGGLWTLLTFAKSLLKGIYTSFASLKTLRDPSKKQLYIRTEKDMPIDYAFGLILLFSLPIAILLWHYASPLENYIGHTLRISLVITAAIYTLIAGFIFSAICAYFTGLIGSSNTPLSGMTLCALILVCLVLVVVLGDQINFKINTSAALNISAFTLIIAGVIACAGAISTDTIQDLKAGQMLGATPWKQQVMLILGAIAASFIIPFILNLLFNAYGIGGVFPRPGMDPHQMLSAPQATLMTAIVQGVFGHHLPWHLVYMGFIFAAFCIVIDLIAQKYGHRFPVLAVALGVYLPLDVCVPLVIGGVLSWILNQRAPSFRQKERGLILACGMVAGAALMGVILAIPFAIKKSSDALKIVPDNFLPIANILGFIVFAALIMWIYWVVKKDKPNQT